MPLLTSDLLGWFEEAKHTSFWSSWDGYYLAACPHGAWSVWDAFALVPLCYCDDGSEA